MKSVNFFSKIVVCLMLSSCFYTKENIILPRPIKIVKDSELCKAAEIHLLELKCEIGQPTKKGKSFEQFCKETQEAGVFINPRCLVETKTCDTDVCTGSK